jgi:beta-phosphoglucomutase
MIRAVVFDWDGTLADTLPSHLKVYRGVLRGIAEMKDIDLYANEGKKSWEIIFSVAPQIGELRAKELAERKQELFRKLPGEKRIYPGAEELLRKIKLMGLKLGLVTGTVRKNVESIISKDMIRLFDHITAADETRKSKPHPEPYLRCLEALKMKPWESVAVENAPLGIQSAKAAGMVCIAVETTLPRKYLKEADFVVRGLEEVEGVIDSLFDQYMR